MTMVQYTWRKFSQFGFLHTNKIDCQNISQASITITDVPHFKMLVYIDRIPSNSEILLLENMF